LVLIPDTAAALSAAGALMSDLSAEYAAMLHTTSTTFDFMRVNAVAADLVNRCREFIEGPGAGSHEQEIKLSVEARYPSQNWELPVQLRVMRYETADQVEQLRSDFHNAHKAVFEVADWDSEIELVSFRARVSCRLRQEAVPRLRTLSRHRNVARPRKAHFADIGLTETRVLPLHALQIGMPIPGPIVVESPVTTLVVDPGATVERRKSGVLAIFPWGPSETSVGKISLEIAG
jgi:N-methylhydantoinase A